jgi:hypothetical protein
MRECGLRRGELVVHVDHQHEVDRFGRQARVVHSAQNRDDVGQLLFW